MTGRIEEIQELASEEVRFYSIKKKGEKNSEFDKFRIQFFSDPDRVKEVRTLAYLLTTEIPARGVRPNIFRWEGGAYALPGKVKKQTVKETKDFGLRLYVVIIDVNHVLLLGGDVKTKQNPEDCPNVRSHFTLAGKINRAIDKARKDEVLKFDLQDGLILDDEDFELEF